MATSDKANGGYGPEEPGGVPERQDKGWLSLEVIGELVLLAIVGAFFAYFAYMSMTEWPRGSRLVPLIAVGIGTPFWFIRLFTVISRRKEERAEGLMDLGFTLGADPKAEARRFTRIALWIVGLILTLWIIGFHIGAPGWVMAYLVIYSRMRLWGVVITGAAFEAFLWIVLDSALNIPWRDPLLFELLGADYFDLPRLF